MAEEDKTRNTDILNHNPELTILPRVPFLDDDMVPETVELKAELVQGFMRAGEVVTAVLVWNIGKLIDMAIAQSEHGEKVDILEYLADKYQYKPTIMYEMRRHYKAWQMNREAMLNLGLGWSAHRALLALKDVEDRIDLAQRADDEHMTVREIKDMVKEHNQKNDPPPPEQDPEELEEVPAAVDPVVFFTRVRMNMDSFLDEFKGEMVKANDFRQMLLDEKRVSVEDFDLCAKRIEEIKKVRERIEAMFKTYVNDLDKDLFYEEGT